jgi:hypothetical protein
MTRKNALSSSQPSCYIVQWARVGHVSRGNLIAHGGVGKVSNYMLLLPHFTHRLQGVSVLYRLTLRIIYTSTYLPNLICVGF